MDLTVALLLWGATLQLTCGVPVGLAFGDMIFMPGDLPVVFDVSDNQDGEVAYNDNSPSGDNAIPLPSMSESSGNSNLPLVKKVASGHYCGIPYGTIVVNGTCHRLLTNAICSEGEWLVKRNDSNEALCVPKPCPAGQLPFKGSCVNVSDTAAVCDEGQMLYVDLTGQTYCDCEKGYFYDPWNGKCFTSHDRASCSFGKYLEVVKGVVSCIKNPCHMEGYLMNEKDNKCYRKQFRGACQDDDLARRFNASNMTVECIEKETHTIFDLPTVRACPQGSMRDFSRRCREKYTVPAETTYLSYNGGCLFGFAKDSRGVCRKTHKLFA